MGNAPIFKKSFNGISIAAWENNDRLAFKLSKSYKDKAGAWKNTEFFNTGDLGGIIGACLFAMSNEAAILNKNKPQAPAAPVQAGGDMLDLGGGLYGQVADELDLPF